jgi:hypothetical protein
VVTKSSLEHPKTTLNTFASTFKKSKEEVCGFLLGPIRLRRFLGTQQRLECVVDQS